MNRSWYTSTTSDSSPDTIHQILAFGSLKEIKELKKNIGEKILTHSFMHYPKKIYTAPTLNFIKKFILHITSSLDDHKYLKFTPRYS